MTLAIIGIIVMVLALLFIPLGIPGTWIMVGVLVIGAVQGQVGLLVLMASLGLAFVAEALEFVILKRLNLRYGGSRLAFWGAIIGGFAGVVIGLPVPIIGSIIAGFIGSVVGAALATLYETRRFDKTMRVSWGVLLGRMWSAVAKVGIGLVILVLGAADLLW
jgi:uncharacterized protein YqgC (DUF456 family)